MNRYRNTLNILFDLNVKIIFFLKLGEGGFPDVLRPDNAEETPVILSQKVPP